MLDEGFNPYESHSDSGAPVAVRRLSSARSVSVAASTPSGESAAHVDAPLTREALRGFDFAAAMFKDENAWREMARVIASDAA
jgi:hypothetical protein